MSNGVLNKHDKIHKYIARCKVGMCCQECMWWEHPEILQFHHLNNEDKLFPISQAAKQFSKLIGDDLQELKDEIDKCVLLCPNCHYWLHYLEGKNIL